MVGVFLLPIRAWGEQPMGVRLEAVPLIFPVIQGKARVVVALEVPALAAALRPAVRNPLLIRARGEAVVGQLAEQQG